MSIVGALKQLADLAEIRGRQTDRQAFSDAASQLEQHDAARSSQSDLAPFNALGIAAPLSAALGELASLNPRSAVERIIGLLPRDLQRLLRAPGVSIHDLATLVRHSGATTLGELAWILETDRAGPWITSDALRHDLRQAVSGLRAKSERTTLGRARDVVDALSEELRTGRHSIGQIEAVGSVRRFQDTVGDITLLVSSADPAAVVSQVLALRDVKLERLRGPDRVTVEYGRHEVTVQIVTPKAFGAALLRHTGSFAHLRALQQHASRAGRKAPSFALGFDTTDERGDSEEDIYESLGLPFIVPELREGAGEVEAAADRRLPRLISLADIRGDLHMHTTWSDGRDSIEAMARRGQSLGYEYLAITDHSPACVGRGLDADRVRRQRDEVTRARERVPGVTILHGIEVDILPDGRLDLEDRVLASLDIVLGSLHDAAGHGPERLTERYVGAMRHPLVDIVTHPANRAVGLHGGYALDFDRLIDAAIETGTALEIDGAPSHLDMDGALARRAVTAGALVSIDSDCHWSEWMARQMALGVATARRGWVEPRHVINARPLDELRVLLRRKRSQA